MPHTRADLAAALSDLGLKAGGVVMIRASVRAVGPKFDTAERAHESWPDKFFEHIVADFIARQGGTDSCRTGLSATPSR